MEASQSLTFESAIKSIDCCSEISNLQIDSSDPSFVSYRHNNFKIIYKNKKNVWDHYLWLRKEVFLI